MYVLRNKVCINAFLHFFQELYNSDYATTLQIYWPNVTAYVVPRSKSETGLGCRTTRHGVQDTAGGAPRLRYMPYIVC